MPSEKSCQKCGKAFDVLFCHRHSCNACAHNFCRNCSNNFLSLSANDCLPSVPPPSSTKPLRCCDSCNDRIIISRQVQVGQPEKSQKTVHERYEFGKQLGEGGFAKVFQATSTVNGNTVAIKVIDRKAMSPEDIEATFQEVHVLESIHHPNIVHLFEFFEEPDNFYMVMECITGGELFDRIVEKVVYTEKEARDLVVLLLNAIKFCHDQNIVHRDLKPENLLLTSAKDDADIKVVDFGFATHVDGNNIEQQVGTPGYIAPEILKNHRYGKAVDMWSFGVILYILLGGYPPFHDDNQKKLFKKIEAGAYEFHVEYWSNISDGAKDLIRRLLDINPETRLTVDEALCHHWVGASDDVLRANNLDANLKVLKKYQATKKWRAGVKAIMAINKMKSMISFGGNSAKSPQPQHIVEEQYDIGKVLGEGGYAVVKEGISKLDQSHVAIKILDRSKMNSVHEKELRHEVSVLRALDHPNIVRAFDLFEAPKNFYVVMELITGGELFDRIVKKTSYRENEARGLARTFLLAVKYLHGKGIVHRDLKPENLLLCNDTDDTNIKLVDFGFAAEVQGKNLTSQCGTPGYMAPEILKNIPYGFSVDMWSFGVILYILLGGYPPFYDKNQQMLFRKIMKGSYQFHADYWGEISPDAKDLISKLLVVDPDKRLTVEETLAHPWLHIEEPHLYERELRSSLRQIRLFQARRKLRAGIRAVIMVNRMKAGTFSKSGTFQTGPAKEDAISSAESTR